ncbi:hypothetical protein TWF696_005931 [Orbilia brochopaga]|uniref:Uncharacterized protein n=1 Tax=Orbilia brochopaga TaxID=3140254 RepID=A0AAV9UUL8_9PEZI
MMLRHQSDGQVLLSVSMVAGMLQLLISLIALSAIVAPDPAMASTTGLPYTAPKNLTTVENITDLIRPAPKVESGPATLSVSKRALGPEIFYVNGETLTIQCDPLALEHIRRYGMPQSSPPSLLGLLPESVQLQFEMDKCLTCECTPEGAMIPTRYPASGYCPDEATVDACIRIFWCVCFVSLKRRYRRPPSVTATDFYEAGQKIPKTVLTLNPGFYPPLNPQGQPRGVFGTLDMKQKSASDSAEPYSLKGPSRGARLNRVSIDVDLEWLGTIGAEVYRKLVQWAAPRQLRAGRHPSRITAVKRSYPPPINADEAQTQE